MPDKYSMPLTDKEIAIMEGKQGKFMRKAMEPVVLYGHLRRPAANNE
jgi:predicted aconitase